ncbi:hypothetical protein XELAEV_18028543mg [Xenopus laevis]|uniref:Uncharacterized protein n=1 Tax=Xenopus laevis TaxID=8355 RepID=A0A974CRM1_XENLA|nr:hypothetical protein XELAEV_18028543mg [Xenopus laevis]
MQTPFLFLQLQHPYHSDQGSALGEPQVQGSPIHLVAGPCSSAQHFHPTWLLDSPLMLHKTISIHNHFEWIRFSCP